MAKEVKKEEVKVKAEAPKGEAPKGILRTVQGIHAGKKAKYGG